MRVKDLVELVWTNLWRRKGRTLLTTLGVVIGTAAIILMMALGLGLKSRITEAFQGFGNVRDITVMPAMQYGGMGLTTAAKPVESLGDDAVKDLEAIKHVEIAAPDLSLSAQASLKVGRLSSNLSISGYDTRHGLPLTFAEGRAFSKNGENVLILGYSVPDNFQEKTDDAGVAIRPDLNGRTAKLTITRVDETGAVQEKTLRVKVIGILTETGGTGDYSVYMPMNQVKDLNDWVTGQRGSFNRTGYGTITVRADSTDAVGQVVTDITDAGYFAFSMKQILDQLGQIFTILSAVLGGIGGISLLVASFGIINTMSMAIYERTREIGIMKVVGASLKNIRNIFLWEAAAIGLMGGLAGIGISWLLSLIIDYALNIYLSSIGGAEGSSLFVIPTWLVIFALTFATLVGLVSGLRPAMKAARLSALNAIRTE